MSIEATAEALATEAAPAVDQVAEPELTEDQELEAVFDRAEEPKEEPEEQPKAEQEEDAAPEEPTDDEVEDSEPVEEPAPSELPKAIKDAWKDIPQAARDAFVDAQREFGRKLGEQGRLIQGISPIRDVLVNAAKEIPALRDMRPQDVATEVFQLAKLSGDFQQKPVETMMGLIKKHGIEEQMQQALAGLPVQNGAVPELMNHITHLERKLRQVSDPEYLRNQVAQFTTEAQTQAQVMEFANSAEHWDAVENALPAAIQFVRNARPDASAQDTLKAAYDLALSQIMPEATKAQSQAAEKAAPQIDPEKTKAAIKAKSVNVTSRGSGKSRELTEDEELAAVYARSQS